MPDVMLVESIPETACVRKRSNKIQLRPLKEREQPTCGMEDRNIMWLYLLVSAPVMRPLLFVLSVVASFAISLWLARSMPRVRINSARAACV